MQSFVPESFDNKWYTYYPDYEANFSISIEFEGKTSGTFYYSDSYELDEFVLGWVTVGKFRTRIDSRDPNKVHITMTGEDLYVFEDDDIVVSGTIEEVILELELPFAEESFEAEMVFTSFSEGTYQITYFYTDGDEILNNGTFKESKDDD